MRKSYSLLIVSATIILIFIVMVHAQRFASPTNDEPANIPSGYAFLLTGKYEDPTHPPFARYLLAIPLFILSPDPMGDHESIETDWHPYGRDFIFRNSVNASDIISWTRFVNITLTCLLAAIVFLWSRKFWGNAGALLSLLFFAFEPTVLGHGSLATTDMAISLIYFLVAYLYMHYRENPSIANFIFFVFAACTAPLVKFSGIIVFISVPLTSIFARRISKKPLPWNFFKRAAFATGIFILLTALAYRFESRSLNEDPQIFTTRESAEIREKISSFAAALGIEEDSLLNFRIPLYSFLKGLGSQIFHSFYQDLWEDANFYQYLLGDYSRSGWFYYFPVAFALKSTLPFLAALLVLIAIAIFSCLRDIFGCLKNPLFVYGFIPFAVYLAFSLTTTINIGIRYILPLYPFLSLFLGRFGQAFEGASFRTARSMLVVVCVAAHLFLSINSYPFYISYFNELAGGRENGWKYLADSNIDWGQDLYFLREDYYEKKKTDSERIFYGNIFGTIRPEDVGVKLSPIPEKGVDCSGRAATLYLSVNRYLLKSALHPEGLYPWLAGIPFSRILGSSIMVWDDICSSSRHNFLKKPHIDIKGKF